MRPGSAVIANAKRTREVAARKSEVNISSLNALIVEAKRAALDRLQNQATRRTIRSCGEGWRLAGVSYRAM